MELTGKRSSERWVELFMPIDNPLAESPLSSQETLWMWRRRWRNGWRLILCKRIERAFRTDLDKVVVKRKELPFVRTAFGQVKGHVNRIVLAQLNHVLKTTVVRSGNADQGIGHQWAMPVKGH